MKNFAMEGRVPRNGYSTSFPQPRSCEGLQQLPPNVAC